MLWLLVLHIIAVLFWAAGLLYLSRLLTGTGARHMELIEQPKQHDSLGRFVFTHIATPAALLAIATGTGVFLVLRVTEFWLVAKLSVVTPLVLAHVATGLLVLRTERAEAGPLWRGYWWIAGVLALLMVTIVWIVLAKPAAPEALPWAL
ncbi:CopD family protein [Thioalkalivibrio thiocyanoxidans]|uniref:CopD family protein n=1 Tax=Thioalkalivibrio thiocyanoxidans TaxID=152475 RepID=UPI000377834F|nr:CopD family protein [Thioalkalivibrio thiocyanoxidans]